MITVEQVKNRLALILSHTPEHIEAAVPLMEEALQWAMAQLRPEADKGDMRIAGLAAAYCACQLACMEDGTQPNAFSAGDIKIINGSACDTYGRLLELALAGAADLLRDSSFQFWTV